jgi:hypothetical protein
MQSVGSGRHKPRTGHAQWVSKRYRTAIRIHVCGIVSNSELPERGKTLRRERLVELNEIHLPDLHACESKYFLRRGYRAYPHDSRFNACNGPGNDARQGLESMVFCRDFRGDK